MGSGKEVTEAKEGSLEPRRKRGKEKAPPLLPPSPSLSSDANHCEGHR